MQKIMCKKGTCKDFGTLDHKIDEVLDSSNEVDQIEKELFLEMAS